MEKSEDVGNFVNPAQCCTMYGLYLYHTNLFVLNLPNPKHVASSSLVFSNVLMLRYCLVSVSMLYCMSVS